MKKYLKGNQKEKVLDIIRFAIATRLNDDETASMLASKGFQISTRSIRRYRKIFIKILDMALKYLFIKTLVHI